MKIYGFALVKNEKDGGFDFSRVSFAQEVKEYPGTYENVEKNRFHTSWDNFLPKSQIGKVQNHVCGTNIERIVYLLEDDAVKAMSLIKESLQSELDELYRQASVKRDMIGVVCGPVREIQRLRQQEERER